ncbi:putative phosphotransferase with an alcohol group as acceptor [Lupinus albus]|uniref:Putative phosphotransferase with an alcohol group as acceptor n=1 Tax=Lupinus albus TaxID=3870 RepID=A0A6A4QUS3_LUPAL|nr:putative phosphotransferase with an alcohol group as acceptor [Lupinus albus]
MAAAKDSVNNISGGSENPADEKVKSVENPINLKASVAENPVKDNEDVVENPVKNDIDSVEIFVNKKVDCLPIEAEEGLKSLAGKWENVVDVNALQIIPLKGAMTNEVFQIKWQTIAGESSRKVLARIYGEGTDIFFDRDVEFRTFECMSKNGQGPRLLGRFANGRIEEFINARTLSASDLRDPSISALIAAKMKEFHDLDMPGPKTVYLWDRLRNWLSEAKRLSSAEEVETFHLDTMDKEISVLEKELSGTHLKIGFCHNDLQYGNIMLQEKTNSVTIIDYEYASYNPVAYDIANHFSEMAANYHTETPHILDFTKYPDLNERRRFVCTYLNSSGQQPSESEVEQLLNDVEKYTLATHLLWGMWGIISEHVNKIDFDYKDYAKQRFQEYWSRKPYLLKSDDGSSQHNVTHGEKVLTYPTKGKPEKKPVMFRKLKKLFGLSLLRSKR